MNTHGTYTFSFNSLPTGWSSVSFKVFFKITGLKYFPQFCEQLAINRSEVEGHWNPNLQPVNQTWPGLYDCHLKWKSLVGLSLMLGQSRNWVTGHSHQSTRGLLSKDNRTQQKTLLHNTGNLHFRQVQFFISNEHELTVQKDYTALNQMGHTQALSPT